MAKVPGFAKAIAGRWRLVEMDNWDSDFLDLVEDHHSTATDQSGRPVPTRSNSGNHETYRPSGKSSSIRRLEMIVIGSVGPPKPIKLQTAIKASAGM